MPWQETLLMGQRVPHPDDSDPLDAIVKNVKGRMLRFNSCGGADSRT